MRTTIDLPDDLHRLALYIARDTSKTLSETVADLIRRGLSERQTPQLYRSERTRLLVIDLGKVTTTEDIRSLEDED